VTHARFEALFPSALATVLLLPSVLVAAIYLGTGTLWPDDPPPAPRGSVVEWADRSFTTRRGFEMWLEANGGDYSRWAKNHPHAAVSRSPRVRRAVLQSAASRRPPESAGPTERQAHFVLFGIAAGAVALFAFSLVRRLPRPPMPALALGGHGLNVGRLVPASLPGVPRPRPAQVRRFVPRPRVSPPEETRRAPRVPLRDLVAAGVPAARRVVSADRESGFDVTFGIVSVALGLIVGILIPILLT
jgi:hypothetical protein